MKKSIGIDLGTTNSVVAFKDTAVKIIRNKENEELTRSCVGIRKGEILVGRTAYQLLAIDPINTILSVKRLMGGAIKDKMVQDMINSPYYKYGITSLNNGTEDSVAVVLGGKQYTPEQISAEILKTLKADAEERLGDEVTHAVITVPAYFTEKQKNATRIAAQLAGLKVQKLLAEPTAAAIAYGVDNLKPGDSKTVIIYDFGGGTFDLSILNIVDGQYMEAGTGGDRWLGGDDLDKKLQELVLKKVCDQYNISDFKKIFNHLSEKKKFLFEGQLKNQSYEAKHQLSSAKSASIMIDNLLEDENGDIIDIDVTISREEFEKEIAPFIERSIVLIVTLLKEVGYDISMIDSILLVGGTSSIPLVKQMLSEKFGSGKVKVSEKPMLSIAEGAGILAYRLGEEYEAIIDDQTAINEISYSTNHNYYIETAEGDSFRMEKVIEKQTPLPIEVSKNFKTTTNFQKVVKVSIYADVENGKHEIQALGYYLIEDNLPIGSDLTFDFHIDTNEILSVKVAPKGKKNLSKQIVLGRGGADHKALKTIDELIDKSIKEYKTIDGEEAFLKYISQRIKEIESKGATEIDDNKWHEIYYNTTEKFDEIKRTEQGTSDVDLSYYRARRLIVEFGDVIDPFDKTAMIKLISQLDSSTDPIEKIQLAAELEQRTDQYSLLNAALSIDSFAERILNIPTTLIGVNNKQSDVNKLKQLSVDAITKIKMKQFDPATTVMDEAYEIIGKYKGKL
jgi:molecular chaperone DnaK